MSENGLREMLAIVTTKLSSIEEKTDSLDHRTRGIEAAVMSMADLSRRVEQHDESIGLHDTILRGGAEPERGIATRLNSAEADIATMKEQRQKIVTWAVGSALSAIGTVLALWWDKLAHALTGSK